MKILNRDAVEFLLIDDDPAITKFLVTYLKQKGHTCEFLTEVSRPRPGSNSIAAT